MLTVEKIGGTSMSQFHDVLQNIIKGNRKGDDLYNRIFVVSAYNNVTNWLLEHKKTGLTGFLVLQQPVGHVIISRHHEDTIV